MKHVTILMILATLAGPSAFGQQENSLSVAANPFGTIPLGSSAEIFNFGGGVDASVSFIPGLFKYFGAAVGADFLTLPMESAPDSTSSIWALAGYGGPVFRMHFGERFSIFALGKVGYYYWSPGKWDAGGTNGGGLAVGGGAGAMFRIAGPFTAGALVSYDYFSKLYNGIAVSLSVRLDFPGLEKETLNIQLEDIRLKPLFPVLYSYYGNNPIGTVKVQNTGKKTANNITLQFYVERYMDNPMDVSKPFSLQPGEEKTVDIYALFTDDLMEVTEGTKVSAKLTVNRTVKNDTLSEGFTSMLEFYNRNALSWDDDRRIASFVTAKDPEIMNFSKNVMTWMKEIQNPAVDENLQKGMAMFEAVKSYGIRYEIDPTTPFSEFSEEAEAIDFLQFPRQTLQYTNGDCDDLTALYTSLLEAVGVETAFITVPGHIYATFALKGAPAEVRSTFSKPDNLIFTDDKVWLPVEITMFQESFEKAWETGAKEWRENDPAGQAAMYPVREAWNLYQAVGFREGAQGIQLPNKAAVTTAFSDTITKYVEKEMYPQLSELKEKMARQQNSIKIQNKIAVLYARYGLYDEAEQNFQAVLAQQEYTPALTNLGNILFIKEKFEDAISFYERAQSKNARNTAAMLGIARCAHELENYYLSKKTYEEIKDLDPDLAARYAYLDLKGEEATRAAEVSGMRNNMVWEEGE